MGDRLTMGPSSGFVLVLTLLLLALVRLALIYRSRTQENGFSCAN